MLKTQMVAVVKKYGTPVSISIAECASHRFVNPDYHVDISWGRDLNETIQKEMIGRGTWIVVWENFKPIRIASLRGGGGAFSSAKERAEKFKLKLEKWVAYALKVKEKK